MTKMIKVVDLEGNAYCIQPSYIVAWVRSGDSQGLHNLTMHLVGGAKIDLSSQDFDGFVWCELLDSLQELTDKPSEDYRNREEAINAKMKSLSLKLQDSKIRREHIEELAKLAELRACGH